MNDALFSKTWCGSFKIFFGFDFFSQGGQSDFLSNDVFRQASSPISLVLMIPPGFRIKIPIIAHARTISVRPTTGRVGIWAALIVFSKNRWSDQVNSLKCRNNHPKNRHFRGLEDHFQGQNCQYKGQLIPEVHRFHFPQALDALLL